MPTDEDRAVVKLLVACGMAQDRVCLRIRRNDGKPICEATLKRHFAHELMVGKVEVETAMTFAEFQRRLLGLDSHAKIAR